LPPKTRRKQEFPEVDKRRFFEILEAELINPGQEVFLDRIREI